MKYYLTYLLPDSDTLHGMSFKTLGEAFLWLEGHVKEVYVFNLTYRSDLS